MKLTKFETFEEMKAYQENDIFVDENVKKKIIKDLEELNKELNK